VKARASDQWNKSKQARFILQASDNTYEQVKVSEI